MARLTWNRKQANVQPNATLVAVAKLLQGATTGFNKFSETQGKIDERFVKDQTSQGLRQIAELPEDINALNTAGQMLANNAPRRADASVLNDALEARKTAYHDRMLDQTRKSAWETETNLNAERLRLLPDEVQAKIAESQAGVRASDALAAQRGAEQRKDEFELDTLRGRGQLNLFTAGKFNEMQQGIAEQYRQQLGPDYDYNSPEFEALVNQEATDSYGRYIQTPQAEADARLFMQSQNIPQAAYTEGNLDLMSQALQEASMKGTGRSTGSGTSGYGGSSTKKEETPPSALFRYAPGPSGDIEELPPDQWQKPYASSTKMEASIYKATQDAFGTQGVHINTLFGTSDKGKKRSKELIDRLYNMRDVLPPAALESALVNAMTARDQNTGEILRTPSGKPKRGEFDPVQFEKELDQHAINYTQIMGMPEEAARQRTQEEMQLLRSFNTEPDKVIKELGDARGTVQQQQQQIAEQQARIAEFDRIVTESNAGIQGQGQATGMMFSPEVEALRVDPPGKQPPAIFTRGGKNATAAKQRESEREAWQAENDKWQIFAEKAGAELMDRDKQTGQYDKVVKNIMRDLGADKDGKGLSVADRVLLPRKIAWWYTQEAKRISVKQHRNR